MTPPESAKSGALDGALGAMLLQQHRSALNGLLVVAATGRVLSFATVLLVGFAGQLSVAIVLAALLVAALVGWTWLAEVRRMQQQLFGIEQAVAQVSGVVVEDSYIEARYFLRGLGSHPYARFVRRFEPLGWWAAVVVVVAAQIAINGVT